ncbi:periplasmic siderophore cleavage esterase IroE family protein [Portibacter lacus]|uniref:Periplasmic siderophore cleavage esterase IroE family protein n=2 Tax=Portibacter lacus TaxID=1099794 RepID=A0AA37WG85_9BACT|nr:periplasmic siderophore cleavage esterase IroE family protein [Portibacter lacus]
MGQSSSYLTQLGVEDKLYSDVFKKDKTIWVHMPADYEEGNGVVYPVVFLLDGGVFLPQLASILHAESPGFMPEMIMVGISNRENRTLDLTTSKVDLPYISASGGAADFSEFIITELIPYIDKNYPTTPYRTLIGHSYGGLFTLNMMLRHTNQFRNYLVIDPSLDWDQQKFFKELMSELDQLPFKNTSLYLGIANEIPRFSDELTLETVVNDRSDFSLNIRSNLEFANLAEKMESEEFRFGWKFYEDELHGTIPLISMFDGLKWMFDWYTIQSPSKFNHPETPIDELITMIEDRTKMLSDHFGYPVYGFPEDLLDMLGHMNLEMGMPEKSYKFFKINQKYYPEHENVYSSMADYYISIKSYERAILETEKAYEISGNEEFKEKIKRIKSMNKK